MNGRPISIVNGRLLLPAGVREGQVLTTRGGVIERVGPQAEADAGGDTVDAAGGYVLPGLVDIHLHGAHGRTFNEGCADGWRTVLDAHRQKGTTTAFATVATAPLHELASALEVARTLLAEAVPGLAGVHLEGPWLSPAHRGAHGEEWLRRPLDGSWESIAPFLPTLRLVTLAPELEGAPALTRELHAAGVVVSAGHSGATPEELGRATAEGLRHVAHLWSGQSMLTKRGPWRSIGLLEAALGSDGLTSEIIADGFHVPAELARIAYRCLGPERLCLVSDASAGTGLPAGSRFRMGSAAGVVDAGVALSLDGETFCGSTSFLLDIVRFCVRGAGIPLADAVRMATATPARVLGIADRVGLLAAGMAADLLILDHDLQLRAVMQGGRWVKGAGSDG